MARILTRPHVATADREQSDVFGRRSKRLKGRVKREVGEATGDRHVEAEGVVEARSGEEPDESTLARAEQDVRRKHGDVPPQGNAR